MLAEATPDPRCPQWCLHCRASWRGDAPCWCCGRDGIASWDAPAGWPRVLVSPEPIAPFEGARGG